MESGYKDEWHYKNHAIPVNACNVQIQSFRYRYSVIWAKINLEIIVQTANKAYG